jgi:hypothetical protein
MTNRYSITMTNTGEVLGEKFTAKQATAIIRRYSSPLTVVRSDGVECERVGLRPVGAPARSVGESLIEATVADIASSMQPRAPMRRLSREEARLLGEDFGDYSLG